MEREAEMLLESPKISQHEWKSKFKRRKRKKIKNGKSRNRLGEQKKKQRQKQKIFFWCTFSFAGYFSWHLRQKTPYKQAKAVSKFFADYSLMVSEAKYEVTNGKGLKILTFKQMLQRLIIALAQIKAEILQKV